MEATILLSVIAALLAVQSTILVLIGGVVFWYIYSEAKKPKKNLATLEHLLESGMLQPVVMGAEQGGEQPPAPEGKVEPPTAGHGNYV